MEQDTQLQNRKSFLKLLFLSLGISTVLVVGAILLRYGGFSAWKLSLKPQVAQQLVEGFPTSPIYPKAEFTDSEKTPHYLGDFSYHGTWETGDSVPVVMAWYLEKLPQEGWFIDDYPADKNAQDVQFIDGHKEDKVIQVSVTREQGAQTTKVIIEYPITETELEG